MEAFLALIILCALFSGVCVFIYWIYLNITTSNNNSSKSSKYQTALNKIIVELSKAEINLDIPKRDKLRKKYYELLSQSPLLGYYLRKYISFSLFEQITELLKASAMFSNKGEYIPVFCWGYEMPLKIICKWSQGGYSVWDLAIALTKYFDET